MRIQNIIILFLISVSSLSAQTRLSVEGSGKLYPIAVPQLCVQAGSSEARRAVPERVSRNLDISGYFQVLNPNVFIEEPGKCAVQSGFAYSDWSVLGAEGLVKGIVTATGNNNFKIEMYLHDVQMGKIVLGKEYVTEESQVKKVADKFSNEIMKYFTGISGVFGSRIAYSSKVGRFKELFIMDIDGTDVRQLTNDRGLVMSAAWAPNGSQLIYTAFMRRVPNVFTLDLNTKKIKQITKDNALEIGSKFSANGSIVTSRSIGREADILLLNSDGNLLNNLTRSKGVLNVSPVYSPDSSRIAFVSDRSGGPQIYVMNSDGSGAERVSYSSSNYCTSPDWSPLGNKLAFVCRVDGFQIFISNPDGSAPMQLTSYGRNEDPSWSPDGRYLAFSSDFGRGGAYNLAIIKSDGSNLQQISNGRSGDMDPAWGPVPF